MSSFATTAYSPVTGVHSLSLDRAVEVDGGQHNQTSSQALLQKILNMAWWTVYLFVSPLSSSHCNLESDLYILYHRNIEEWSKKD